MVVPVVLRREDVVVARGSVDRRSSCDWGVGGARPRVVTYLQLQLTRSVRVPPFPVHPGRRFVVGRAATEERLVERVTAVAGSLGRGA